MTPLTETRKSFLAFWLLVFQAIAVVAIAVYFAVVTADQNAVLNNQAKLASELNRVVIREVQRDVDIHAHADRDRNCAIAKELEYLVKQSPDVKPEVLERVAAFTVDACRVVPIGRT